MNEKQFAKRHLLSKGIKTFGKKGTKAAIKGTKAAIKKVKQLHSRECFRPLDVSKLNDRERKRA